MAITVRTFVLESEGAVRFEAEWIERQHRDGDGEINPELDELGISYHSSKEEAERAAIEGSRSAGACNWIMVVEQKFNGREWVIQRMWTGTQDGLR